MRIEKIDIPLILPQPMPDRSSYYGEDEKQSFFLKLFKKKEVPEKSFYEERIEEFGYDVLYSELNNSPLIYHVRNTAYDNQLFLLKTTLSCRDMRYSS